jgi:putative membrane protein
MKLAGTVSNGTLASISSAVSSVILGLFLVSIMVILVSIIIALLEYRNYAFTFEEFDLKMRRGIFDRREVSLPYRQIQDVDIERDVSHQLLGLSKLVLMTAGHEEAGEHEMAEVLLEPLDKEAAEEIRAMLQRKIGIQVVETEQEADREAVPVK